MDQTQNKTLTPHFSGASSAGHVARLRFRGRVAHARRLQKRQIILDWLQRFGSTDQSVIARLIGASRSSVYQTIRQLESATLIRPVLVDGCKSTVYILTETGRDEADAANSPHLADSGYGWCEIWARPPVYPSKLPISHIQHDHLVQRVTLDLIGRREKLAEEARATGFVVGIGPRGIDDDFDYVPDRTIRKSEYNVGVNTKVPDLVLGFGLDSGFPMAIVALEVQQS